MAWDVVLATVEVALRGRTPGPLPTLPVGGLHATPRSRCGAALHANRHVLALARGPGIVDGLDLNGGERTIEDLDLGKYTAVDDSRTLATHMSEIPDPICGWSGEPVFGM